ncbi:hypothetical protein JZ751_010925 [Albula glossodonta]|uniref:Uncharacterized protein n=1 Tax=Albula glossodonta TaxID=121402 RepID=A0A8T2NXM0_9TELE|nr:hypothetical protein JZ751_010925 [Albula glossodonta]
MPYFNKSAGAGKKEAAETRLKLMFPGAALNSLPQGSHLHRQYWPRTFGRQHLAALSITPPTNAMWILPIGQRSWDPHKPLLGEFTDGRGNAGHRIWVLRGNENCITEVVLNSWGLQQSAKGTQWPELGMALQQTGAGSGEIAHAQGQTQGEGAFHCLCFGPWGCGVPWGGWVIWWKKTSQSNTNLTHSPLQPLQSDSSAQSPTAPAVHKQEMDVEWGGGPRRVTVDQAKQTTRGNQHALTALNDSVGHVVFPWVTQAGAGGGTRESLGCSFLCVSKGKLGSRLTADDSQEQLSDSSTLGGVTYGEVQLLQALPVTPSVSLSLSLVQAYIKPFSCEGCDAGRLYFKDD